ncbi:MAG: LysR family transcriptional regulator, partial [Pseudomonadota bacterium]
MHNKLGDRLKLVPSFLVFQEVVRWQSFTKAATALGMSKSAVSLHVTKLEKTLCVSLIKRNTRNLAVTAAGQALFDRGQHIGDMLGQTLAASGVCPLS